MLKGILENWQHLEFCEIKKSEYITKNVWLYFILGNFNTDINIKYSLAKWKSILLDFI